MNIKNLALESEQLSRTLNNLSTNQYYVSSSSFHAYINFVLFIITRIDVTYSMDKKKDILKSLIINLDKLNVIHITNSLSKLGYTAEEKKYFSASNTDYPCLVTKNDFISEGKSKVLFKENDKLLAYDPFKNTIEEVDNPEIYRYFICYTFSKFDQQHYDLSSGVLKFFGKTWFVTLLLRFKLTIINLIIVSGVLQMFSLVIPIFIIYTYNRIVVSHDSSNLFIISSVVVFLLICEQAIRYLRGNVIAWLTSRVDYIVTTEVVKKLTLLPIGVVRRLSLPSQIARIRSFASVRDFFSGPVFSTILELPAILIMIAIVTYFHYLFSIVYLFCFAAIIASLILFHRILVKQIKSSTYLNTEKYYQTLVFLEKVSKLHYLGLANYYQTTLSHTSEQSTFHNIKTEYLSNFIDNFGRFVTTTGILIVFFVGIFLIWKAQISVGVLLAVIFLSWRIFSPIQVAASTLARSEKLYRAIKQIDNFFALADEQADDGRSKVNLAIKGTVQFINAGVFHAKTKKFLIKNFNLTIKSGETLLISGKSGGGKSTLLQLINGSIIPDIGKVLIEKHDIKQLSLKNLREQTLYLSCEKSLIPGTVFDNILLSNPMISKDSIIAAAKKLEIETEFSQLPSGFETYLQADCCHNSSKELIMCINMLKIYFSDQKILLIDDIKKSFYDPITWHNFLGLISGLKGQKTIVIASNDSDLINLIDNKINLDD